MMIPIILAGMVEKLVTESSMSVGGYNETKVKPKEKTYVITVNGAYFFINGFTRTR